MGRESGVTFRSETPADPSVAVTEAWHESRKAHNLWRARSNSIPTIPVFNSAAEMGLLSTMVSPFMGDDRVSILLLVIYFAGFIALLIVGNVLKQLLFKNPKEPPVVFHVVPFIGSTIEYGIDPVKFFDKCKTKVGDCTPIHQRALLMGR
jgi:hypothetical protein